MPAPPNEGTQLAYMIPSLYINHTHFTYINGMFRLTFFEQHLSTSPGSPEVNGILSPRVSVTITPASFAEFLRIGREFYDNIARQVAASAATMMSNDESNTMQ